MYPETFIDVLQRRLGDPLGITYRLRMSPIKKTWCIEQKIGSAVGEGQFDLYHDDSIRARDGFALIAEIHQGSMFKCPGCGFFIKLEPLKWKEYQCSYCFDHGEKNRFFLAYYPFSDRLLEHLEKTSPKRGGEWMKESERKNQLLRQGWQATRMNNIEAILKEHAPGIVGVGSTTDVRPW